jgi:hypothetical protein
VLLICWAFLSILLFLDFQSFLFFFFLVKRVSIRFLGYFDLIPCLFAFCSLGLGLLVIMENLILELEFINNFPYQTNGGASISLEKEASEQEN